MKIKIVLLTIIFGALSYAYANGLSQSQYDLEVKNLYNKIEMSQTRLQKSVDSNQSHALIIQRACEYANTLNALERLATQNSHITKAKEEAQFARSMRNAFERSFQDLGTSYQKSCKS